MTSHGLLSLAGRRHTCLPELVQHFGDDTGELLRFLRHFAGTRLLIPGPELFRQLERETAAAAELAQGLGPADRLACCRKHKMTYVQLREVYAAVHGVRLTPPEVAPSQRLESAAELLRANRHSENDIAEIFALTTADRSKVRRLASQKT